MNKFTTACVIRRSKVLIVFTAALFGLVTLVNNVTDYAAYADYIGRIISMSNTEGNDSRRYRAIHSTMFHHRFYWAIISLDDHLHSQLPGGSLFALSKSRCTT